MNEAKLILLPGLGADHRLFHYQLKFFPNAVVPPWLTPKKDEALEEYAVRWSQTIDFQPGDYIAGMSFGGQVALELAKYLPAQAVFLISSHRRGSEISPSFKLQEKLLQRTPDPLVRAGLMNIAIPTMSRTEKLNEEAKSLMAQMVQDLDMSFFKWATKAAADWDYEFNFDDFKMPIYQIHGEHDSVIRISDPSEAEILKGASHLINYSNYQELNKWLQEKMRP